MRPIGSLDAVRSSVKAVVAAQAGRPAREAVEAGLKPVVTISRQAGIDAAAVATKLVDVLNQRGGVDPPWLAFDRELVERVAEDHHLEQDLVTRLDEHDKSWFEHFTAGITGSATGTDIAMKTARTIRALAWVGRAVIVGRGGQSVLAGLKHVVHVRLIAPHDWRVEQYATAHETDRREAERRVEEVDAYRARYVKGHFARNLHDDLLYDITLNMARVSTDRAADVIGRMVSDLDLS
jgi:cytidylate kinase